MINRSLPQWLIVMWLVVSQLGGALLLAVPITLISALALLTLTNGGIPGLFVLSCLSTLVPLLLAGFAWVAYARGRDGIAALLSGICLLIGVVLYLMAGEFSTLLK